MNATYLDEVDDKNARIENEIIGISFSCQPIQILSGLKPPAVITFAGFGHSQPRKTLGFAIPNGVLWLKCFESPAKGTPLKFVKRFHK
jgi:hypothetical protein